MALRFNLVSHTINSLTAGGNGSQPVAFTPDGRFVLPRSPSSERCAPTSAQFHALPFSQILVTGELP